MSKVKCATCIFWERSTEEAEGYCNRYPPVLTRPAKQHEQDNVYVGYLAWQTPITHEDDWCGEHRYKES